MTSDPFALPAFVLSVVGLVIAVVGAGAGVVSLAWQIRTRTRGAHRVTVHASSGIRLVHALGTEGPYIQIEIRNAGASAVQIRQWSIRLADGNGLIAIPARFPPQPELPYMLLAGTSVTFHVLTSAIADAAAGHDLSRARAVAHLATGEVVRGKRGELKID